MSNKSLKEKKLKGLDNPRKKLDIALAAFGSHYYDNGYNKGVADMAKIFEPVLDALKSMAEGEGDKAEVYQIISKDALDVYRKKTEE